jgi:hypothetical protein
MERQPSTEGARDDAEVLRLLKEAEAQYEAYLALTQITSVLPLPAVPQPGPSEQPRPLGLVIRMG